MALDQEDDIQAEHMPTNASLQQSSRPSMVTFVDASWDSVSGVGAGGFVVTKEKVVHAAHGFWFEKASSALMAEAAALRLAVRKSVEQNWENSLLLSDAKGLINAVNGCGLNDPGISVILDDIWALKNQCKGLSFGYVSRDKNVASHNLARFVKSLKREVHWTSSFPTWLLQASTLDVS